MRLSIILLASVNIAAIARAHAAEPSAAEPRSAAQTYMGRTIAPPMHFSGAGWLVRETRNEEEKPAKLLKALELKAGQIVCDFGCGNGFYTLQLAKLVGPRGAVVAVDIQPEMLKLLAERAGPRGLDNVKTVLATAQDPGLPADKFDLVLMVDVYHELSDPPAVLAAIRRSLKPTGRIAVVEFREEDPSVPILPLHKMSLAQIMREIPPNGLKLVGQDEELPWQHVLFFARNNSPLSGLKVRPWQAKP